MDSVGNDGLQPEAGELSGLIGAVLVHYVQRALGTDGVLDVMDRIGTENVVYLVENWEDWVDFEIVLGLAVAVAELCHEPDVGRRTGEELFRVLQERGMLNLPANESLVDVFPDLVHSLNTAMELRHAIVKQCEENMAVIEVTSQEPGRSRFLCRLLVGLYAQLPSLRESVGAVVETRCISRGDDVCEFVVRWRSRVAPGTDPWADRVQRLQEWAVRVANENVHHASEAIEAVQLLEEFSRKALRDPLTGLANRSALEQRAAQERERRGGSIDWLTLLFLDLDGFKAINDDWGHAAGDDLLQQLAKRLLKAVRATDLVARVGGDEFVLLFPEVQDDAMLESVVRKVLGVFKHPYVINGNVHHLSGSVGVSRAPDHGGTFHQLLDHADGAMYRVKKARKSLQDVR